MIPVLPFPPGLILVAAALVLPWLRGRWLDAGAVIAAAATLVATLGMIADPPSATALAVLPGLDLIPLQVSYPTRAFATIFALVALVGTIFALRHGRRAELSGAFLYAGSAICATCAGDLLTLFVWWELMAIGSTVVVWTGGQRDSGPAGLRYAAVHLVGGVLLLAGIAAWAAGGGGLAIPPNPLDSELVRSLSRLDSAAAWLMLVGILINAGAPPLGAWIADAYPEASPSGTVFLSAFTTKTAVFVLIMLFAGTELLVWVGMGMAMYGIIWALLENDMRRILAYSIVNQVGFMVCAVGLGTELALDGATAHAFAHIIYKALLLMAAGSVLAMTGRRLCSDLGGLYRSMPLTLWCGLIGAFAISAVPLTSGFTTKSMISTAAGEVGDVYGGLFNYPMLAWFELTAASAGVFLHAGIKFPWFVFFQVDTGLRPPDPPAPMRVAMVLLAALCLVLGVWTGPLYALLPYAPMHVDHLGVAHPYNAYTADHVIAQLQLLCFAGLAFFLLLPMLKRTRTITIDGDWFYRRLLPVLWCNVLAPALAWIGRRHAWVVERLPALVADGLQAWRHRLAINEDLGLGEVRIRLRLILRLDRGRTWTVGGTLVVITGVLALYLALLLT